MFGPVQAKVHGIECQASRMATVIGVPYLIVAAEPVPQSSVGLGIALLADRLSGSILSPRLRVQDCLPVMLAIGACRYGENQA